MGNEKKIAGTTAACGQTLEFRSELASRIARLIGSAEKQATPIPRLTLHQRTAPTAACHVMYEPSIVVVAQGRKDVQIGRETVSYDSFRYLLTSVDLPTVTRVAEASSVEPCLAAALKIDISIVREFLGREEFHMNDVTRTPPECPLARSRRNLSVRGAVCSICSAVPVTSRS